MLSFDSNAQQMTANVRTLAEKMEGQLAAMGEDITENCTRQVLKKLCDMVACSFSLRGKAPTLCLSDGPVRITLAHTLDEVVPPTDHERDTGTAPDEKAELTHCPKGEESTLNGTMSGPHGSSSEDALIAKSMDMDTPMDDRQVDLSEDEPLERTPSPPSPIPAIYLEAEAMLSDPMYQFFEERPFYTASAKAVQSTRSSRRRSARKSKSRSRSRAHRSGIGI